ncbi:hypothetical protein HWV54_01905 [Bartonella alsatica]|uniref:Uncharacterized protein n=2 Tax=Bartonella alsatica TaxID=52764 RepID=J0YN42_9HYPH|nr:hypothetical protein [Bartonella alsatica]EJF76053.1 hypothetical protein MEC_00162 [Bartonella alsatica IBS 382]QLC51714.1 hypothetical protein HWV54_01905 [Bartonella alsatica]
MNTPLHYQRETMEFDRVIAEAGFTELFSIQIADDVRVIDLYQIIPKSEKTL